MAGGAEAGADRRGIPAVVPDGSIRGQGCDERYDIRRVVGRAGTVCG